MGRRKKSEIAAEKDRLLDELAKIFVESIEWELDHPVPEESIKEEVKIADTANYPPSDLSKEDGRIDECSFCPSCKARISSSSTSSD